tara:strand:+ start:7296 stop:7682 length:387 start_codon:yes stop_codon:yes gene_type:complete
MADHNEALRLAEAMEDEGVSMTALDGLSLQAAALLRQLSAERDQLRAEVETLKVALRMGAEAEVARAHEVVGLRAEVERLRSDADRYRWLADCNNFYEAICLMANPKLTAHALGEAIDHARTTHKDEG